MRYKVGDTVKIKSKEKWLATQNRYNEKQAESIIRYYNYVFGTFCKIQFIGRRGNVFYIIDGSEWFEDELVPPIEVIMEELEI